MQYVGGFLLLLLFAKTMRKPIATALMCSVVVTSISYFGMHEPDMKRIAAYGLITFLICIPYFWLLDLFEKSKLLWLLVFAAGGLLWVAV